jgi:hypothetical protein
VQEPVLVPEPPEPAVPVPVPERVPEPVRPEQERQQRYRTG